jgi:signal transduction histidine kinase/CheY-like chemotaxis protein
MDNAVSGYQDELRISPRVSLPFLALAGLVFVFGSDGGIGTPVRLPVVLFGILLHVACVIAWREENRLPELCRWLALAGWVAAVVMGSVWLFDAQFLLLLFIPTILAAIFIGIRAATLTAVGGTVIILGLPLLTGAGLSADSTLTALLANWAGLGIMYLVRYPIAQLAHWVWLYAQRAEAALEETRDRKVELEQTLGDLAHANRQLTLTNERLAAMRQIAEEAQKNKAMFVARVSHEFRTPLNMIIGLVDLLTDTPEVYGDDLPPALFEDLQIVHRNCEHLSGMINDVLDLSQAEAGRLALQKERVNLADLIYGALSVVSVLVQKKNLAVQVNVPPDLPEVYCDRTRIRQVIVNLVSNAVRFTDRGSISVTALQEGQEVVISVADTGPGIAPDAAATIFEPFSVNTNSLRRERSGNGLGLSISKQFIELHDGRIWLETAVDAGATFSFSLPVSPPLPPLAPAGRWIREDWLYMERSPRSALARPANGPPKPRMVVCDETGGLLAVLTHYADQIEFVPVQDLAEVCQALRDCPAHIVAFNALSASRVLQLLESARAQISDTPVVGYALPPPKQYAQQAGASDYLIKPVTRAVLETALQKVDRPIHRVLVVDDDPDVARLLTRLLHARDPQMAIGTAANGADALRSLRDQPPDLMLLDIIMPDMEGWEVLEQKKQDETLRDVPVILISAQDPAEQPIVSKVLVSTMGGGLPLSKLLDCSLEFSAALLKPD